MMHRNRVSYSVHRVARRASPWLTGFCAIEPCLAKLPAKPTLGVIYEFTRWQAEQYGWWLIASAGCLLTACAIVQKSLGSPAVWETLHALLCGTQAMVFPQEQYTVANYHRVTLFRGQAYRGKGDLVGLFCGFFTNRIRWLVPIVRSGHTDQNTRTRFSVGDSEEECHGIAGRAWFQDQMVSASGLPDLNDHQTGDEQFRQYAEWTGVPEEELRRKRPRQRSLLAVPVKMKGELWGVLVFDSRDSAPINRANVGNLCKMLTGHLGTMIERVL